MAVLYSSNVEAGQPSGSSKLNHARARKTLARFSGVATINDIIVFGVFKGSDIIVDARCSIVDNAATLGTMDVGLYTVDYSNGATSLTVVDIDLFETTPFVINADIAYPGTTLIAAALNPVTARVTPLWSLAGAASDLGKTYAFAGTIAATIDSTIDMLVEIDYVAGD